MPINQSVYGRILHVSRCCAILVASVSFTSNLAFFSHNFGDEKNAKNHQNPNIYRNMDTGSPRPKGFCCFVFIEY